LVKRFGGTRFGVYAISISPQSVAANTNETESVARIDPTVKTVVDNRSIPYGGSYNFTAAALVAKQAGVDLMFSNLDANSNYELATAYKQAGIKTKATIFPVGYDPSVPHSPTWKNVQGDIFEADYHPFYEPNAGTRTMQATLERYDRWTASQFPTYSDDTTWLGAELMIKGLEGAGPNPTRASVVTALHGITKWDGDGLLPFTINFSKDFGHPASANCIWLTRAEPRGFVPLGTAPVCGTYIAGTSSISSGS
jgi:ABC-type branched-subunit amino acid transport system substrate-binding protein